MSSKTPPTKTPKKKPATKSTAKVKKVKRVTIGELEQTTGGRTDTACIDRSS